MAIIPFPKIPEVADGQVVGETYLMLLGRATDYLLGESHAAQTAWHVTAVLKRSEATYGDPGGNGAYYYLYHASDTLVYAFWAGEDHGAKTWYVKLEYYGDDSAWHEVEEWTGTEGWEAEAGTLDLSAEANLTIGTIYPWRFQTKTSGGTYNTSLQVTQLATRTAVSGWTEPPAFAAATSDYADCNILRTDLDALYAGVVPSVNPLAMCEDTKKHTHTADTWQAFARFGYRYRPNGLHCSVMGNITTANWGWRVRFADSAGNEATVFDEDDIAGTGAYELRTADIDLTTGDAATNLAAAGISLVFGNGYIVTIEAKRQTSSYTLYLKNAVVIRTSDGTPDGDWDVPELWVHGDTDLGPTGMNKFSTDLGLLYTGGDEELWGDHHASAYIDGEERPYGGVHRKRYLIYRVVSGGTAQLLYGTSYATEYGLPTGDGWLTFDLTSLNLAPGSYYIVDDAQCAWESDSPYA